MPAAKLRPVLPRTTTRPPVMYSQPWSPTPSVTTPGAGVADAEPLADPAAEEDLARRGAVGDHVAGDDLLVGLERRRPVGPHDDPAAGQALADVVVGVALEPQRDAARHERAERLAGRAGEGDVDGAVGQALAAVLLGDLVAEDRADGAVDVADRRPGRAPARRARAPAAPAAPARCVERLLEAVVLRLGAAQVLVGERWLGRAACRIGVRSSPDGLPVVDRLGDVERRRPGRSPRRGCGSPSSARSSRTSSAM